MTRWFVPLALASLVVGCRKNEERYIPAFIESLKDRNPEGRFTAVRSLGSFGPTSRNAVPRRSR